MSYETELGTISGMRFIFSFICLFILTGCSNILYIPPVNQGSPINQQALQSVHTGDKTQTVLEKIGQPSFKHVYHHNQWYYVIASEDNKTPAVYKLVFKQDQLSSIKKHQAA